MIKRATTQISAFVCDTTRAPRAAGARPGGVTRAHVIEQALLHHLQALDELPDDVILPARIVLDAREARRLDALIDDPPAPTAAMLRLFDGG